MAGSGSITFDTTAGAAHFYALTIDTTSQLTGAVTVGASGGGGAGNTLTVLDSATGQTSGGTATIDLLNSGTFNTTSSGLLEYGISSVVTASRSTGSNPLTNIAGYFDAENAQTNDALYTNNGNVVLNAGTGTTAIQGALTAYNAVTIEGTSNETPSACRTPQPVRRVLGSHPHRLRVRGHSTRPAPGSSITACTCRTPRHGAPAATHSSTSRFSATPKTGRPNYALYTANGDVDLNVNSGNTTVGGNLTVQGVGTSNFAGTLEQASHQVFSVTGNGITSSGATVSCVAFTSSVLGCAPASGGGSTNFLRADGTWTTPAGVLSGLTSGDIPVATGANTLGNSDETDNGTTFASAGGQFAVALATGAVLAANGSFSNASNLTMVGGEITGGFVTTSGAVTAYGVVGESIATRQSGTNALTNIGLYGTAANGQTNNALQTDAGNVVLNNVSGTTTVNGALTAAATAAVTGQLITTGSTTYAITDEAVFNPTYTTTNNQQIDMYVDSAPTVNTSGITGGFLNYGTYSEALGSRSSGSALVDNYALYASAANGDVNVAIYADSGDVKLNQTNGNTYVGGEFNVTGTSTFNAAVSMSSFQIHNLADPTSTQDAATENLREQHRRLRHR